MKLRLNDYEPNEVIRIIREWTGLTQEDFGKAIGKKTRTVQDYESGDIQFKINLLKELCKKFNIEITIEKK